MTVTVLTISQLTWTSLSAAFSQTTSLPGPQSIVIDLVVARERVEPVVPGAAALDVRAAADPDDVVPVAAIDRVVAVPAAQQVVAVAAVQRVVPGTAEHAVVAALAVQRVVAAIPEDAVVPVARVDGVVTREGDDPVGAGRARERVVPHRAPDERDVVGERGARQNEERESSEPPDDHPCVLHLVPP